MTGFAGWRDCWNQLDWGRIRFVGNDLVFVPLVSFTGRAPLGDVIALPIVWGRAIFSGLGEIGRVVLPREGENAPLVVVLNPEGSQLLYC